VRSGKSRLAERMARASRLPVTYIATARAGDGEMVRRIAAHRERRPAEWRTLEVPLDLPGALTAESDPGVCLLVECLTLWLTNLLMEPDASDAAIAGACDALRDALAAAPGRIILVGNETNMGVVPLGEVSRRYCDHAGRLHQLLGAVCDQVTLTVAGLPLAVKGPAP
jgi:adenosylcobinamide kinase/adenosylcobinamide-phosphate guanylyltransferase